MLCAEKVTNLGTCKYHEMPVVLSMSDAQFEMLLLVSGECQLGSKLKLKSLLSAISVFHKIHAVALGELPYGGTQVKHFFSGFVRAETCTKVLLFIIVLQCV